MERIIMRVDWLDSLVTAEWSAEERIDSLGAVLVCSVGYLYKEDAKTLRLAGMCTDTGDGNAVQVIPKGCIISRAELKEG